MADESLYPEYEYQPYEGDMAYYGFQPEHVFFNRVYPEPAPEPAAPATFPEDLGAPVFPAPTPMDLYEDRGDRSGPGRSFDSMSFGELNQEVDNRERARDIFDFGMPDTWEAGLGKAAMFAAPPGVGIAMSLAGSLGLDMTEDDFRAAYERGVSTIDRNKLRAGETLESRTPRTTAGLNRILGYNHALAGLNPETIYGNKGALAGLAAGGSGYGWGPRNAEAGHLTGTDYVNAIADNPGAGSARYSFDDLFGGDDNNDDDRGNSMGGFDGDRESSPGGQGGY